MTISEAKKVARANTMACWWNSRAFPKQDNIKAICSELRLLASYPANGRDFNDTLLRAAFTLETSPQT